MTNIGLYNTKPKSKKHIPIFFLVVASSFLFLCSCKPQNPNEIVGATTGKIEIVCDENIKDLIQQELEAFEAIYKYSHISISYEPAYKAWKKYFDDSVDVIISARNLSLKEFNFLNNTRKEFPRPVHFATGALAFVCSKQSTDTVYNYEDFVSKMKDPSSKKQFIIENAQSGISDQLLQILGLEQLPAHFFGKQSKNAVLDYVTQNKDAIGIIDYSDISDSDLPYTQQVLEKIHLIGISRPKDSLQYGYVQPFQYNLQDKKYPFTRDLYFISKTGQTDVSSGFSAYIAGEIGQKIVLKAGLLPIYQSQRWIELKNDPIPTIEK